MGVLTKYAIIFPVGSDNIRENLKQVASYHSELLRENEDFEGDHFHENLFLDTVASGSCISDWMLTYGAEYKRVSPEPFVNNLKPFFKDAISGRENFLLIFQSEFADSATIYQVSLNIIREHAQYRRGNEVWDIENNKWRPEAEATTELAIKEWHEEYDWISMEEPN